MQHQKWDKLDHAEMTAMEAIFMLDNLVDSSDPDVRRRAIHDTCTYAYVASHSGDESLKREIGQNKQSLLLS